MRLFERIGSTQPNALYRIEMVHRSAPFNIGVEIFCWHRRFNRHALYAHNIAKDIFLPA